VEAHRVQHLHKPAAAEGIEDLVPFLAIDDDSPGAQHRQMLRRIGLFYTQSLEDSARGDLSLTQHLDNGDARGMRQSLKDIRFELPQRILHSRCLPRPRTHSLSPEQYTAKIRIFAILNMRISNLYWIHCREMSVGRAGRTASVVCHSGALLPCR